MAILHIWYIVDRSVSVNRLSLCKSRLDNWWWRHLNFRNIGKPTFPMKKHECRWIVKWFSLYHPRMNIYSLAWIRERKCFIFIKGIIELFLLNRLSQKIKRKVIVQSKMEMEIHLSFMNSYFPVPSSLVAKHSWGDVLMVDKLERTFKLKSKASPMDTSPVTTSPSDFLVTSKSKSKLTVSSKIKITMIF